AGEFGTYAQRSVYQLYVAELEHTGIGKLYAQFEALKEKFRREGLFESARKRPMPSFPLRIALVSAAGKGAEDFLTTIAKRAPQITVEFVETRVQGDGAEIEIADAIDRAGRMKVEVIVVARGGGSYEDLFPFNLEPVVRAIVRAKIPVLSAIGHTGDQHVSDLVADQSCETPSNAAQFFGEIRDKYLGLIERAKRQLEHALRGVLGTRMQRFDYAQGSLVRVARNFTAQQQQRLVVFERRLDQQTPKRRLDERARSLDRARSRLDALRPHLFGRAQQRVREATTLLSRVSEPMRLKEQRLRLLSTKLEALDPRRPLQRGYAIVTHGGKPLHDAAAVAPGAVVEAQLQRGTLLARVESVRQPAQESER
ncbi:MAG: exodeoxyribonuclease VII large subunit, partial [Candidatus Eremiobacteraeota bacterium]|nr:exodeoxyribonuclease VII large subunit [Candidatus Eremiobacteraeota bacterium]